MKKIEIPSGNSNIDWILSSKNNGIKEHATADVVRFLIQKHNDLIDAIENETKQPTQ